MIFDRVENLKQYAGMPCMEKVTEYILKTDLSKMEVGKYDIDGDNLYVMIQEPAGRTDEEAKMETHHDYADLQLVIKGAEYMGVAPETRLGNLVEAHEDKDLYFYDGSYSKVLLKAGQFAVLFPNEGHTPNIRVEGAGQAKKAVFKIKM